MKIRKIGDKWFAFRKGYPLCSYGDSAGEAMARLFLLVVK